MGTPQEGYHRLPDYQRTSLARERTRLEAFVMLGSAVVHDADPEELAPVLAFYRNNADVFVPSTTERAEVIFQKDLAVARRYDEGVAHVVNRDGFGVVENFYLGDLLAERRGRIWEIGTMLHGVPRTRR